MTRSKRWWRFQNSNNARDYRPNQKSKGFKLEKFGSGPEKVLLMQTLGTFPCPNPTKIETTSPFLYVFQE